MLVVNPVVCHTESVSIIGVIDALDAGIDN